MGIYSDMLLVMLMDGLILPATAALRAWHLAEDTPLRSYFLRRVSPKNPFPSPDLTALGGLGSWETVVVEWMAGFCLLSEDMAAFKAGGVPSNGPCVISFR